MNPVVTDPRTTYTSTSLDKRNIKGATVAHKGSKSNPSGGVGYSKSKMPMPHDNEMRKAHKKMMGSADGGDMKMGKMPKRMG